METKTEPLFCQSCGMPLTDPSHYGTRADGTAETDYCIYCYAGGRFTQAYTMDEMIDHCVGLLAEFNKDSEIKYTPEQAREEMKRYFPTLKRWKKQA